MKSFHITSRRAQEIILVLYALSKLRRICTKQEVLAYIREYRYYAIQPEDRVSYEGKSEWRSDTLLCWGRKDAVIDDWMIHHDERDSWDISRTGVKALAAIRGLFDKKTWEVHRCYMWTEAFKLVMDPTYRPSERDWQRPKGRHAIMENLIRDL